MYVISNSRSVPDLLTDLRLRCHTVSLFESSSLPTAVSHFLVVDFALCWLPAKKSSLEGTTL